LGSVAELDVARLRADLATAQAEALALDRRRAELEHALAVLLGETASSFRIDEISDSGWQAALPVIPPGIPGTVLARRPDVAAAQRTMLASQARVGIAKAAWFPGISLTTQQGYASPNLRDLIAAASRAYGVGLLLSLPLFDGGRKQAAVQGASAELEASLASYREQILVAVKEVEDQLSSLRQRTQQAQAHKRAVTAASRATTLAKSRYNSGLASQLELLDTQRNELRSRRQAVQVNLSQYQSTVGLIRALGGDWGTTPVQRLSQIESSGR
jgi:multidrug efflux system outer membrane protein